MAVTAKCANVTLNIAIIVIMATLLVVGGLTVQSGHHQYHIAEDNKNLLLELRRTVQDVQTFSRAFAATQNNTYLDFLHKVIGVWNGSEVRPVRAWQNHFQKKIADSTYEIPVSSMLRQRMEDVIRNGTMTDRQRQEMLQVVSSTNAIIIVTLASLNTALSQLAMVTALHSSTCLNLIVTANQQLDDLTVHLDDMYHEEVEKAYRTTLWEGFILFLMVIALFFLLVIFFFKVEKDAETQDLLHSVLPERVVDTVNIQRFAELREIATRHTKLLRKGQSDPDFDFASGFPVLYSEFLPVAWVAFTDVVGFTKMCRLLPAQRVISLLNELFSMLDVEATYYGVEKIKTIGDSFMCAKLSVSEASRAVDEKTRANRIAMHGIDILSFLLHAHTLAGGVLRPTVTLDLMESSRRTESDVNDHATSEYLELRSGVHVGPVASGIVGFERPLYDLFGDTVNTAARLESSGMPNKVQLAVGALPFFGDLIELITFDSQVPAKIHLKGMGEVTTKFVIDVAENGTGTEISTDRGISGPRRPDAVQLTARLSTGRSSVRKDEEGHRSSTERRRSMYKETADIEVRDVDDDDAAVSPRGNEIGGERRGSTVSI